jgi:translation initiation factor IF-2
MSRHVVLAVIVLSMAFSGCSLFSHEEASPDATQSTTPVATPAAPAAAAAEPTASPAAPVAPTPATPAEPAASGDPCGQYEACCNGMAGVAGMEAMQASCSQIGTLRASPAGPQACSQALNAIKIMPNAPAACH